MSSSLIRAGTLIDGGKSQPRQDVDIHVVDGRIKAIGARGTLNVSPGTPVVDKSDKTVMPGLIDLHVHFGRTRGENEVTRTLEPLELRLIRSVKDSKALLHAGFTAARDVGGLDGLHIRNAINEGEIEGPTLHAAGLPISQTSGHGDMHFLPMEWVNSHHVRSGHVVDGVDECRKATRLNMRMGVDLIKMMASGGVSTLRDHPKWAQFSPEEARAVVEEAARFGGKPVAAHAGGAGVAHAVAAGVRTIEHAYFLDEPSADAMAKADVIFVPTLLRIYLGVVQGPKVGASSWLNEKFIEVWDASLKGIEIARKAGVKIGLGTDLGLRPHTRHGTNWREIELMVDAGLSMADGIRAGTSIAAEAMGLQDQLGTVEVGKRADLIALGSNPLNDSKAFRNIQWVMRGGDVVRDGPPEPFDEESH